MNELLHSMRQHVANDLWFAYVYVMLFNDPTALHRILMMAATLSTKDVKLIQAVFERLHAVEKDYEASCDETDPQYASLGLIDFALKKGSN